MDVKGLLGLRGSDQVMALPEILVIGRDRISSGLVLDSKEPVDLAPDILRLENRAPSSPLGRATSLTLKDSWLGSFLTTKGACLAPRKFGPPERDLLPSEK